MVQLRDKIDSETGQRYTIKKYESEKQSQGEAWQHASVTLRPANPAYAPIVLEGVEEDALQVVAELVEVLDTAPPSRET